MSRHPALANQLTIRPLALAVRLACAALFIGNFGVSAAVYAQASSTGSANVGVSGADEYQLPAVKVTAEGVSSTTEGTGSYTAGSTGTATRFELSPRDTPQSVSVITRTQMDDFGHIDINDALESTPGITVERVESDRVYYTARGFDVTNFQVDGIGLPFLYGHSHGNTDTVIYDRIEVLRGATGLMSSMSNPSATINFVRKRPTAKFQAAASVVTGSWNTKRIGGDISGALTEAGNVRGRVVAAYQEKESYLDRYAHEKGVFYGVVEADIAHNTMLTLGHHRQNNNADSPLWGALPLFDTSGNRTNYDISTSTAADWSYWDGRKESTFLELSHYFANGWQGKAVLTKNKLTENSKLFYVYGTPNPTTAGSDLYAYPSRYDLQHKQTIFDLYASGPFTLFDRKHELMIGYNWSTSRAEDISHFGQGIGTEIPQLENWNGSYPEPAFNARTDGSNVKDKQSSVYAATRLSVTDALNLIAGARLTNLDSTGVSYGSPRAKSYDNKITPYVGATYRVNDTYSVYGSYTKLFRPQTEVDVNRVRLDPVTGKGYEAGVKGEFMNKRLNSTFAVFKTKQRNLAEAAGRSTFAYHTASDEISSVGYEIDVAGELTSNLQIAAGYTHLKIEDPQGNPTRTFLPKRLLRVSTTYRIPSVEKLKVGASINWQGDTYFDHKRAATTGPNAGQPIISRQQSYALLSLMARYDFSKNLSATLNVNNLTDKKYYNSLYWASNGQAYYGAPRNVLLSLNWKY